VHPRCKRLCAAVQLPHPGPRYNAGFGVHWTCGFHGAFPYYANSGCYRIWLYRMFGTPSVRTPRWRRTNRPDAKTNGPPDFSNEPFAGPDRLSRSPPMQRSRVYLEGDRLCPSDANRHVPIRPRTLSQMARKRKGSHPVPHDSRTFHRWVRLSSPSISNCIAIRISHKG